MPTASRMIGAVLFAALAFIVSEMFKPLMPEGTDMGRFSEYNAVIGFVCGWVFMSLRYGAKGSSAIGSGLTGMFATLFWVMILNNTAEMLRLSVRKQYDGPVEAIVGVFQLMIKYGAMMATPEIIITLLLSGVVIGMICGWAARNWR